jgi:hypothetical protein
MLYRPKTRPRNARRRFWNCCFTTTPPAAVFRDARDVPPRPAIGRDLQLVQAHAASLMWGAPNFWLVGKQRSDALRRSPNEAEHGKNREAASAHRDLDVGQMDAVSQRAVFAAFAYTPSQYSGARCRALDGADVHRDLRVVSSWSPEVRYQLGA